MKKKVLQYGYVYVDSGKHKEKVGYYDDDEGPNKAIVYFGEFLDGYVVVDRKRLKPVILPESPLWKD